MAVISFKLSPDGKQQVERALMNKAWGIEDLVKSVGLGDSTVKNFRAGRGVERKNFAILCNALELNWAEVKDPPDLTGASEHLVTGNQNFEIQPPIIEGWVGQVRERCCQKIFHQHGKIQLLNQTEIGVDELYVDVWLLNRSPRTYQVSGSTLVKSFDLRNDRLGLGDRIQRDEGMVVANENSKLLILGKPGSGKTTFLKHLAVDCSNGKFQPDLIPVLIELRRIRSTEWRLLTAVAESLEIDRPKTQELLDQGKLLILLDGLDEVPTSALRREVQAQISQLSEALLSQALKYAKNRLILTCRTQIIEVIPQGFTSVEVADFNAEQVKAFVSNWFRASRQTESNIAQQWQAFSEEIQKNPALKELTVTPVLLSLICLVLQDEGELPSQTTALYRKSIRLLLEKWNDRKDIPEWEIGKEAYRQLSIEEKESLLTEIAARKFENPGNFVLFEQADLTQQIAQFLKLSSSRDGEAVLRAIEAQHGLMVERADELWSFSHLTFQEYFTAQWLSQLQQDQGLAEKIADKRWQEVVKLAVKSQQPADRLLRLIKQAINYSTSNDQKIQDFLSWVQTKAESTHTPYKSAAIRSFYFALARELDRALTSDRDISLVNDRNLALDLYLDRAQDLNIDLDLDLERSRNLTYALDQKLDQKLNREIAFGRARFSALDSAQFFTQSSSSAIKRKQLRSAIKLKQLGLQLLMSTGQTFRQLRRSSDQDLMQESHQLMVEYYNVGHDWQFNNLQKGSLQRYYDANKFLIDLIQEPRAVSDSVRQEIEDNLLLPIATLQQRLPEHYS